MIFMFLQIEIIHMKPEQNNRWLDGTYINNDYINIINCVNLALT